MLKPKLCLAVKCITFILLTCFCVCIVNNLFRPKYYFNEEYPSTNTFEDFYNLQKNSVDVLFFGSSHAVTAFNPQVIYDNYGITSYNLSCEQQSPVITYYWLQEALKYQTPKAVVIDTHTFFKYEDLYIYNNMNCSEAAVRKAMDFMRFSPLKYEAAKTIAHIDPSQSALSFILLNIRYHTRWTKLGEKDFTEKQMIHHGGIKGFSALGGYIPDAEDVIFSDNGLDSVEAEPMAEVGDEYLRKIADICKNNNIELILTNIPSCESIQCYKTIKTFADENGIRYYDFNEKKLYDLIGYNSKENKYSHLNYLGAEKVSLYLGQVLKNECKIDPRNDSSYDLSRAVYEHRLKNIKLEETTDAHEYLRMLNDANYSLFAFGPVNLGDNTDNELVDLWRDLGFSEDIGSIPVRTHYCAVKTNEITEKTDSDDLHLSGSIRNGRVTYSFTVDTSVMLPDFHKYSMCIDGTECGNQMPGLDIVVYDNDYKMIIDKVNINTTTPENTLTRY